MKLEHAALYTKDLEGTRDFFVKYFGATANTLYHNPRTGLRTYFLSFDGDARLEIMSRPDTTDSAHRGLGLGYAHISFSTGSKKRVDTLTETLRRDGYAVVSGPRTTGDGYYESCVAGPEGCLIEIAE